ncbi:MAG: hypothetical protein ACI3XG_12060 [Faecousia sp.]
MKKENVCRFLRLALQVLACGACAVILLLNIVYLAEVRYDIGEKVLINFNITTSMILLAAVLLLTAVISRLDQGLEKINLRKLFFILSAIYTVIALYLILNAEPVLRADANSVHTAAKNILAGDYQDFEKGAYLSRYPHQLGLTLYESILALFSPNPQWNMLVNFLMVLGINCTAFLISRELFHNRSISLLTILGSFAFMPQLFFVLFVYGTIPGFLCIFSGFYQALRFAKDRKAKNLIALVLLCAGAVTLKSNYAIGVLAIAFFLVLQMLKERVCLKMAVALVSVLLCMVVPGKLVKGYFEAKTGADLNQGTPMNLYLAMGTNIDNWARIAGWYDGTNYTLYTEAEFDKEAAQQMGTDMLKDNLDKIRQRPRDTAIFFLDKTVSQWCEPLYQSLWSGPLEDVGQKTYTRMTESLYCNGLAEDTMTVACKFVSMLIWVGTIVFLICCGKKTEGWELFLMYFLGGLIFHTFWEGKSQYIYPYVFSLIPCAVGGIWELSRKMKRLFSK